MRLCRLNDTKLYLDNLFFRNANLVCILYSVLNFRWNCKPVQWQPARILKFLKKMWVHGECNKLTIYTDIC